MKTKKTELNLIDITKNLLKEKLYEGAERLAYYELEKNNPTIAALVLESYIFAYNQDQANNFLSLLSDKKLTKVISTLHDIFISTGHLRGAEKTAKLMNRQVNKEELSIMLKNVLENDRNYLADNFIEFLKPRIIEFSLDELNILFYDFLKENKLNSANYIAKLIYFHLSIK